MRILKITGIITLIVILILIGIAYILPRTVTVERSIQIYAADSCVFEQVNYLQNWINWSPWAKLDPAMNYKYSDPSSGTGAWYEWNSEKKEIGNGKLTIKRSIPYDTVLTELVFMEQAPASGGFYFTSSGSETRVTWFLTSDLGNNPISRYYGLFVDSMLGGFFESGLQRMKTYVEVSPGQ